MPTGPKWFFLFLGWTLLVPFTLHLFGLYISITIYSVGALSVLFICCCIDLVHRINNKWKEYKEEKELEAEAVIHRLQNPVTLNDYGIQVSGKDLLAELKRRKKLVK